MKLCDIAHGNAKSTQTKRHMQADLLKASALHVFFLGLYCPDFARDTHLLSGIAFFGGTRNSVSFIPKKLHSFVPRHSWSPQNDVATHSHCLLLKKKAQICWGTPLSPGWDDPQVREVPQMFLHHLGQEKSDGEQSQQRISVYQPNVK
jgi:hypothetical protein